MTAPRPPHRARAGARPAGARAREVTGLSAHNSRVHELGPFVSAHGQAAAYLLSEDSRSQAEDCTPARLSNLCTIPGVAWVGSEGQAGQGVRERQEARGDGFTHLHTASGYSARYGASPPRDLVARAAARGISALALTDRDCITGAVRFVTVGAAHGVRPVLGVDLAVTTDIPADAGGCGRKRRTPVRGGAHVDEPRLRITVLAQTAGGWARLCRMVSAARAVRSVR
ncbi:hypothetical protein QF037_009622 [Streptomyces canus]|nr:hypothetical protein [Streptomyces canus]